MASNSQWKELAGRLDLGLISLHVYSSDESEFAPMRRAYVEQACEIVRQSQKQGAGVVRLNDRENIRYRAIANL